MVTTTWVMGYRRGAEGTGVVEVRGVVVAIVRDGVVGIREVPQDWTTGDGITEVPL
jgi:succinate dehydrogenase/fumarate reductase cytochrome b subunit